MCLLGTTKTAAAGERELSGVLGTTLNPAGLQLSLEAGIKAPLTGSTSALLRDAHLAVGINERLTPAYSRTGAWIRLAPLSILSVKAGAEVAGFFGTFRHITSFASYDEDFSGEARRETATPAEAAWGYRLYAAPAFQIAVGRLAVRTAWTFEHWKVGASGPFYYEPSLGTLLDKNGDDATTGGSVALIDLSASGDRSFQVGLLHEVLLVRHAPQNRVQRLGPFLRKQLATERLHVRHPVLYAGVVYYLECPDRSGIAVVAALGFDGLR